MEFNAYMIPPYDARWLLLKRLDTKLAKHRNIGDANIPDNSIKIAGNMIDSDLMIPNKKEVILKKNEVMIRIISVFVLCKSIPNGICTIK